ncbi:hypothetical protein DK842_10960 [Chromobacterium phragmitis]|uniref:Uncharacterized protein n=1 Tax=Chromobacterium phragmitis TaxID=2202141 RepID=A0A344UKF0_9NEIS|nr:hypothetical protein DK842_10960 [Chromobacterium phragmitis]AXE35748.1 hypothetical protein DK843_16395 [Chromobacterium phragmitis]
MDGWDAYPERGRGDGLRRGTHRGQRQQRQQMQASAGGNGQRAAGPGGSRRRKDGIHVGVAGCGVIGKMVVMARIV